MAERSDMRTTASPVSASRTSTAQANPVIENFLIVSSRYILILPMSAWKGAAVASRTLTRFAHVIGDYRCYRRKGFNSKVAWCLASTPDPAQWNY
jgi:hypothetical protein